MKSSRDVLIQNEHLEKATLFYEKVLGFNVIERTDRLVGFETGGFRLFIEKGIPYGPVFEFTVPNLEHAKRALVEQGCSIEQQDLLVPRCYVRDPFGLIFNLAEKPLSQ